jgi:Ser/Thr protein kinase RdoA (MazF antagonist)
MEADRIARLVETQYEIGSVTECRSMHDGLNHTFAITADRGQYAVRVYGRNKWWVRGDTDLLFELDLLDHLYKYGVSVACSIRTRTGQRLTTIDARRVGLFTWAPGKPKHNTPAQVFRVGATLAEIHVVADSFESTHHRYRLDLSTLLDRYIGTLGLDRVSAAEARFVRRYIAEIRRRLAEFDPGPTSWGVIHGDVQELNYHFDGDRITFFDFDLCGYGWRAYDIAVYYTRIPKEQRGALIRGYESVRPLTTAEHEMLPTFGRLAWIREGCQSEGLVYRTRRPYMSFA